VGRQSVEQADRQVIVEREQFLEAARLHGPPDPLVEFVEGQPAFDERVLEDPDGTVLVGH